MLNILIIHNAITLGYFRALELKNCLRKIEILYFQKSEQNLFFIMNLLVSESRSSQVKISWVLGSHGGLLSNGNWLWESASITCKLGHPWELEQNMSHCGKCTGQLCMFLFRISGSVTLDILPCFWAGCISHDCRKSAHNVWRNHYLLGNTIHIFLK